MEEQSFERVWKCSGKRDIELLENEYPKYRARVSVGHTQKKTVVGYIQVLVDVEAGTVNCVPLSTLGRVQNVMFPCKGLAFEGSKPW